MKMPNSDAILLISIGVFLLGSTFFTKNVSGYTLFDGVALIVGGIFIWRI